jgi:hypothetical protein
MKLIISFILLLALACNDEARNQGLPADMQISLASDVISPDVQIVEIPDITVDAYVDPCGNSS